MVCDGSEGIQQSISFFGVYEMPSAYLFAKLLRPGMTVVDAGANVGQYTLLAATGVGPTGDVHSFEPVPSVFDVLEANVAHNQLLNVRLNRAGLWCCQEQIALSHPKRPDQNLRGFSAVDKEGI